MAKGIVQTMQNYVLIIMDLWKIEQIGIVTIEVGNDLGGTCVIPVYIRSKGDQLLSRISDDHSTT